MIAATGEDERAIEGYVVDHGLERLVTRSDAGLLQGALAARGLRRKIAVTTPHFLAALAAVSQSDIAALLPRRLATAFIGRYRLALFEPPYHSPPFEVMSLWHRENGDQPAIAWLRQLLREVAAGCSCELPLPRSVGDEIPRPDRITALKRPQTSLTGEGAGPIVRGSRTGRPSARRICAAPGLPRRARQPISVPVMFAVIRTGGKQYKVAKDDVIAVEKLAGEPGATIEFGEVLMVGDGADVSTGTPLVAGASVSAELVEHRRADKIIVFKKKRRQNYRRKNGHRQHQTVLRITEIRAGDRLASGRRRVRDGTQESGRLVAQRPRQPPGGGSASRSSAARSSFPATSSCGSAAPSSIPASGSAWAATTRCSRSKAAPCSSRRASAAAPSSRSCRTRPAIDRPKPPNSRSPHRIRNRGAARPLPFLFRLGEPMKFLDQCKIYLKSGDGGARRDELSPREVHRVRRA